jgi:hypothetical protein
MDKNVASILLDTFVRQLRALSYRELCELLRSPLCKEVSGPDGKPYQIESEALWDDPRKENGALRVIISIDHGTVLASLRPLTSSFLIAPDGTFVGE